MNQGKLEVVKQEMARVNINILGVSELKWAGMVEFKLRPKHWSFNFRINSSKEYSGLISFRMDWLDLLAVQGTHKSLFQQHSSKSSSFFMV